MLSLELTDRAAVVRAPGGSVLRYVAGEPPKRRPYVHPISLPGGPELTADRPPDHVHHHGLWVAHHRVESRGRIDDFYLERGPEGEIVHVGYEDVADSGDTVGFTALHRWVAPDGYSPLEDRWEIRVGQYENGDVFIDFGLTLLAVEETVRLHTTNEGALPLIRVAPWLSGQNGGLITNSRGATREWMTFGRRAEWVDYSGPDASGTWQGIAIFDHPSNPSFPSPWFTRDYGPFGPAPNCFDGDFVIAPWRPLLLRYRIVVHRGDVRQAGIARRWQAYWASAWQGRQGWRG
ncbi:MAG TPA: PmoA family protein [Limnochordales bacterium]